MNPPTDSPVALVTGSAVRVGRTIVSHLAQLGYRVWIHYRSSEAPAQQLAQELGDSVLGTIGADLAQPSARARLAAEVSDAAGPGGGRLDLLVNNAASYESGPFDERSDDDFARVLETNLIGPVSLVRGLLAALRTSQGSVVNISDLGAQYPWRGYLDHNISKAGLDMATRGLALELAPDIRVNTVSPGTVIWPDDEQHAPGGELRKTILDAIPMGRIQDPQDIVQAVAFLARAPNITGQILAVDGGRSNNLGV